ncbi:MAG: glycosyltransferase family 2 protein [Candidatus Moranbacteria bacterium]|jgi:GT2 family glycosyltransferase|nr:glycosyltransferase family 2 protein [Candidatus Moranbacteria bacterium]MDD5651807.1 glycosyltransferase family 2 protein [Candidatus Moranbacteria bacterium]MDX9856034.1 glycosyltransferase family 2 protein [Candidatus Moranbacteria bacterium]
MKEISFIIVNYKSRNFLEKCADSIGKKAKNFDFEIIIVNNDEKNLEIESENIKNIKILEINKNMGFGASCNRGADKAEGEISCFLNPDAQILSGNLGEILESFKNNKEAGIIGPKVIEKNGDTQKWSAGKEMDLVEVLRSNLGFPRSRKIWESDEETEADWATGAAMFIKKDLFTELGGFDENFFLYFEDIDLCKRARERGKKVIYFPYFKVRHIGGASSANRNNQKKEYYESQDYYFEKWFGRNKKNLVRFLRKFHF